MSIINLHIAIPEWTESALCARTNTDVFHPDKSELGMLSEARRICRLCPVATKCFEHAMDTMPPDGIYAGTTPRQRGQLRRRLRERRAS
jgi:WhiB family redox-sensing transcriptional regulator